MLVCVSDIKNTLDNTHAHKHFYTLSYARLVLASATNK